MKKNFIIIVLLIITILMGGTSYYIYKNQNKIFKNCPVEDLEKSSENKEESIEQKGYKLLEGIYKYREQIGYSVTEAPLYLNVEVNILNNSEMTISADDTLSEV